MNTMHQGCFARVRNRDTFDTGAVEAQRSSVLAGKEVEEDRINQVFDFGNLLGVHSSFFKSRSVKLQVP